MSYDNNCCYLKDTFIIYYLKEITLQMQYYYFNKLFTLAGKATMACFTMAKATTFAVA